MALERLTQITEVGIQSGITLRNVNVEGAYVSGVVTATSLNVTSAGANFTGVVTATSFDGNVTGNITPTGLVVSGVSTFQASSFWGDGDVAYFGDGQDLLIFHNSTDSIIRDNGTGDLFIEGGNRIRLTNPTGIETYAVFNQDGAVELYHDNVKKLETSGIGVSITSALTVGTGASISSPATNVLTLGTNDVERVRINSNGAIGIGTASPQQPNIPSIHLHTNTSDDARIAITTPTKPNSRIGYFGLSDKFGMDVHNGFEIRDASASYATRLSVDSSGRVTVPYQPAFQTVGTNYSQSGAAYSIIIPNVVYHNQGSHYNGSTGRFTAPVAGRYLFGFWGLSYPHNTEVNQIRGFVNGSATGQEVQFGGAAHLHILATGSILLNLNANDIFDFRYYQASGSAKAYSSQWNMWGYLIG